MATVSEIRPAVAALMAEDPGMSEIEAIVRATWGNAELMAEGLQEFAFTSQPAHSLAWVAKKAHGALSKLEWELFDRQLNRELGLPDDFVG